MKSALAIIILAYVYALVLQGSKAMDQMEDMGERMERMQNRNLGRSPSLSKEGNK